MNPETRLSLLARLRDANDDAAWNEFVELYLPVIYRSARILGFQDADSQDVAQQVLLSVSQALAKRPHDPAKAKFRTWLFTVTRNTSINLLRRANREKSVREVGEVAELALQREPTEPTLEQSVLEQEYEKELFRSAARRIQAEFTEDSWNAFWWTAVDGKSIPDVADLLGKQVGSIYAARSRVMRRLRLEIEASKQDSVTE
ncbi:MAG: sigma-70 family RNA polymerase sigma factor [Planctomycetota bacterium]